MGLDTRSATELARAIRAGETTSRTVVQAHIDVLERAQPRIHALAADRFEAALEEADAADERVAAGGELGPLHGVPCTIKESFAVAGMPNSAGLVARRDHRAERDAVAVARLRAAGAIVLGVTNTSELTLWIESTNRLYGRTNNAYDRRRTAGGSSGGEGAAVGCGGAPFGLGTDFGGSIRLPAFFNGVFGHKPGLGIVPVSGHFPGSDGESGRMLGAGPLARRCEDLMPLLRILAGPDGEDPLVGEVSLGDPDAVALTGLDVVVSEHVAIVPVSRELREARDRAAAALEAAGARVRHESLKSLRRAVEYYLAAVADGSPSLRDLMAAEGVEPVTPRGALRRGGPHTPAILLTLLAERFQHLMPGRRKALAAGTALADEVDAVLGDGVLLHPPFRRTAPRHGGTVGRPWVLVHMAIWNLLSLPVTQVPLGLGRRGLPLGVQIVAAQGGDHRTIAVARELESRLGGWVPPRT